MHYCCQNYLENNVLLRASTFVLAGWEQVGSALPLPIQGIHVFPGLPPRVFGSRFEKCWFKLFFYCCLLLELYPPVQQITLCAVNFLWSTVQLWGVRGTPKKFRFETLAFRGLTSSHQLHVSYIFI